MNIKNKLMTLILMINTASMPAYTFASTINPFTNSVLPDGYLGMPNNVNYSKVPDNLNFDKMNEKRDCSPAELLSGKTTCNKCDPDVPNVVKAYSPNLRAEMAKNGGFYIYGDKEKSLYEGTKQLSNGFIAKYNNSFDFKPFTGSKPSGVIKNPVPHTECNGNTLNSNAFHPNDRGCYTLPTYIVYRGYNLQGINNNFSPLNNRTVCELIRPQNNGETDPKDDDPNKFKGAKLLGIGGATIALGATAFNKLGSMGMGNQITNAISGGVSNIEFQATKMFACLEYYTGTNPSYCGGDHVRLNRDGKSDYCRTPVEMFYKTKVPELMCGHYPCDGELDGVFRPATVALRQMLLSTNPMYPFGNTAFESIKIAQKRPMVCVSN